MPELSVIVCTNRPAVLARFVDQLAKSVSSSSVDCELIVVDDGSNPPVAPAAGVDRVLRQAPRGASAARNAGATAAVSPWLLFCDDDLELGPEAIDELWRLRQSGRCFVPQLRGTDGRLQNAFTAKWSRGDLKLEAHTDPVSEVAFPVSACLFVERSTYWRAGGMDERFAGIYYEDVMFGFALRRLGVPTLMLDAIAVHHPHGAAGGPVPGYVRRGVFTGRWLFAALALRGRQRVIALCLGLPRTIAESVRLRSIEPAAGYLRGLRRVASPPRRG